MTFRSSLLLFISNLFCLSVCLSLFHFHDISLFSSTFHLSSSLSVFLYFIFHNKSFSSFILFSSLSFSSPLLCLSVCLSVSLSLSLSVSLLYYLYLFSVYLAVSLTWHDFIFRPEIFLALSFWHLDPARFFPVRFRF